MNLPPALAPWAPYLQDFPLEVGPALGQFAQRMAALIGPSGQDFDQPEGEVDGYDGLTRRGLPERMLLSDWLLAGEVPDEWSRRAAEGELSYLQLARRAPQVSKVVAALFDAGPDALGAPRLGQLAALLVLARRARERGAELVWGIAQKPTEQLWHDVSPSGATALLEARGCPPPTASDLEIWREALGECDELWLIGGQGMSELAAMGESQLLFEDPFEVGRALDVAAHCEGREVRRARLELPADAICARLLRDPFGAKTDSSTQVRRVKSSFAPQSNLVWIGANALAARSNSGGIVVFRVPSSPRGGVAKPKHYQVADPQFIHYVGYFNGSIVGARLSADGAMLYDVGGRAQNIAFGFYPMSESPYCKDDNINSRPLQPLWNFGGSYRPVFLLPSGDLCRLVPRASAEGDEDDEDDSGLLHSTETYTNQGGEVKVVAQQIRAAEGFSKGIIALSGSNSDKLLRLPADPADHSSTGFFHSVLPFPSQVESAFWGGSCFLNEDKDWWGVGAYQTREGWLMQWSQDEETRLEKIGVAPDESVLGVVGWKAKRSSPALLVRGAQNRGLTLRGLGWHHPLAISDAVEGAAVSPMTPYIAWATKNEVTVYSLSLDAILARWQWGESE